MLSLKIIEKLGRQIILESVRTLRQGKIELAEESNLKPGDPYIFAECRDVEGHYLLDLWKDDL